TARCLPRVVRRARAVRLLVGDDARVAADLFRALRVAQQVGIVSLLPDEHEMRRCHELGDEAAARSGTRERIGAHAIPAGMRCVVVTGPQLLVDVRIDLLDDAYASEVELLPFHAEKVATAGRPLRREAPSARARRDEEP